MHLRSNIIFRFLLVGFFTLSVGVYEVVGQSLSLSDAVTKYSLGANLKLYKDTTNALSIEEISELSPRKFLKTGSTHVSDLTATYWLRLEIKNLTEAQWFLQFDDPDFSVFELYRDTQLQTVAGSSMEFEKRRIFHKNFVFPLELNLDQSQIYHVKLRANVPTTLTANVSSRERFFRYAFSEYYYLGAFYGVLFIMAMYNLMLFWSTRDRAHIWYVFYVLCSAFFAFNEDGLGFQFFWPSHPVFNLLIYQLIPVMLLISFVLYAAVFIENRITWNSKFKPIFISTVVVITYYFVHRLVGWEHNWWFALFFVPLLQIYLLALRAYFYGKRQLRFFIVGSSAIIISLFMYFFRLQTLKQASILEVYVFNFAFVLEAIALSLALGEKIRLNRKERSDMQSELIESLKEKELLSNKVKRELEEKVQERTVQLVEQARDLEFSNAHLEGLKKELFKLNEELDLANYQLKKKVTSAAKSNVKKDGLTFEEFKEAYPDKASCLNLVSDAKWRNGYSCSKCKHTEGEIAPVDFSSKCKKCNHKESATTKTLFHALKFDLRCAMYIAYVTQNGKPKFTLDELSDLLDVRKNTCWNFKKKVKERMSELNSNASFSELIG